MLMLRQMPISFFLVHLAGAVDVVAELGAEIKSATPTSTFRLAGVDAAAELVANRKSAAPTPASPHLPFATSFARGAVRGFPAPASPFLLPLLSASCGWDDAQAWAAQQVVLPAAIGGAGSLTLCARGLVMKSWAGASCAPRRRGAAATGDGH